MTRLIKNKILWIAISGVLAVPQSAWGCAACAGRSDDVMAQGLNAAVLTMMAVLLTVLGSLLGFMAYLIRRAAKHPLTMVGAQGGTAK
ncbi:MAG: hypothetical protein R3C09_02345 [Pirellulaceae bacterium]